MKMKILLCSGMGVFMYMSNLLKRVYASDRRRGVTLIEAVLYISIALALIVGGLVFFQQASLSARVSQQIRVLSSIVAESRALFVDPSSLASLPDVTGSSMSAIFSNPGSRLEPVLLGAGSIPASARLDTPVTSMWGTFSIRNEWSGHIMVAGGVTPDGNLRMVVGLIDIPRAACTRLAWADSRGVGAFTDGVKAVGFSGTGAIVLVDNQIIDLSISNLSGSSRCGVGSGNNTMNLWYTIALK